MVVLFGAAILVFSVDRLIGDPLKWHDNESFELRCVNREVACKMQLKASVVNFVPTSAYGRVERE